MKTTRNPPVYKHQPLSQESSIQEKNEDLSNGANTIRIRYLGHINLT